MARVVETDYHLGFRLANPNRDQCQDLRDARIGGIGIIDEGSKGHVKTVAIREVPPLSKVLKAANGVNSRSAVVFRAVFDPAKFSF